MTAVATPLHFVTRGDANIIIFNCHIWEDLYSVHRCVILVINMFAVLAYVYSCRAVSNYLAYTDS